MSEQPIDKIAGGVPEQPEQLEWLEQPEQPEQPAEPEEGQGQGADETTGASPGTAQACDDLGLNSLAANLERFGIKPPGQA